MTTDDAATDDTDNTRDAMLDAYDRWEQANRQAEQAQRHRQWAEQVVAAPTIHDMPSYTDHD